MKRAFPKFGQPSIPSEPVETKIKGASGIGSPCRETLPLQPEKHLSIMYSTVPSHADLSTLDKT